MKQWESMMGLRIIMRKLITVYSLLMVLMSVVDISFTLSFLSSPIVEVYEEGIQCIIANIVLLIAVSILFYSTKKASLSMKWTFISALLMFILGFLLYFVHSYGITIMDYRVLKEGVLKSIYLTNSMLMLLLMLLSEFLMVGTIVTKCYSTYKRLNN